MHWGMFDKITDVLNGRDFVSPTLKLQIFDMLYLIELMLNFFIVNDIQLISRKLKKNIMMNQNA